MSDLVTLTKDGEIGIITIDNPPVNALSPGVPEGIELCLDQACADGSIAAVVMIGAGRTFIAGADIKEFGKITSGERKRDIAHQPMILKIEDAPKPVVCAIHGTAFGGGLEVAMGAHYRVALSSALVGQPEVKLGIIPGAGGTQRLPRLAGIAKAVEMCWQGEPIAAAEALEAGIVDRVVEGDLLAGAVAFAREVLVKGGPLRKTRERNEKLGDAAANAAIFAAAREAAAKKKRGQTAPLKAIEAVEGATRLPFDEGVQFEAKLFRECFFSDQSKAMIHVFFGERAVAKVPGLSKNTPTIAVHKAAVVGAGTMGGGIAMAYVNAGIPVILKECSREALDRGLATIRKNYSGSVKRGRLSQKLMNKRIALIQPTLDYDAFAQADIVIEAVFEAMALKKQVFAELDKACRPDAILATNTSTLSIDEIASATTRPHMVVGHHFFSPANVMRLLEIVRGNRTSPEVTATSLALAKKLSKVGVVVGNCRGFVGNRMFGPYRREAQFLVEEGASPEQVDQALYDFGMAMGPLATGDLAGLDVGWRIRQAYKHLERPGVRQPLVEDRLCELRRFGQKTGAGWYRYDEDRRRQPDPEVDRIIEEVRHAAGVQPRTVSSEEIVERTIYALINEGARILEEGIALRAVDVDMIYVTGYGFPVYRGGPMWYADTVGVRHVYDRVCKFEKQHGELWAPAPLLRRLAEQEGTFAGFDKAKVGQ
jgi:3-hydroxyacyl-CoA dehydrogenase